ncbi:putative Heat shock transcription factor family [Medicago truncatula]|uniref:Heat stress transcription factor-like protein, putative n=1 Tax=Medicago truncatula TaxID=3880 RepID=G7KM11_MEDTR|nr:heat stress transcription factor-like protein, putative [Medicago truncatula]RHN51635.1 putative Heat shock transcription factor family [Medicago truncatula]
MYDSIGLTNRSNLGLITTGESEDDDAHMKTIITLKNQLDEVPKAIASGDQVQPVAEGSLVDNPSNFRLEFRNCFPRDISNKLLLELSPAVLDMNLISCRTQGSNEDEERLQKNMSEGEQTRTGLAFTAETLDHADIGTSYTFNMDLCIS